MKCCLLVLVLAIWINGLSAQYNAYSGYPPGYPAIPRGTWLANFIERIRNTSAGVFLRNFFSQIFTPPDVEEFETRSSQPAFRSDLGKLGDSLGKAIASKVMDEIKSDNTAETYTVNVSTRTLNNENKDTVDKVEGDDKVGTHKKNVEDAKEPAPEKEAELEGDKSDKKGAESDKKGAESDKKGDASDQKVDKSDKDAPATRMYVDPETRRPLRYYPRRLRPIIPMQDDVVHMLQSAPKRVLPLDDYDVETDYFTEDSEPPMMPIVPPRRKGQVPREMELVPEMYRPQYVPSRVLPNRPRPVPHHRRLIRPVYARPVDVEQVASSGGGRRYPGESVKPAIEAKEAEGTDEDY